jgi:hypothetical protein
MSETAHVIQQGEMLDNGQVKHACLSVSGSRGTGKSTLVHALRVERNVRRFLVMDPLGDYKGKVDCYASTSKEVDTYFDDELLVTDDFSLAYAPDDMSESDAASYLADMAFYLRNCTLIIEEAHDAARHPDCPPNLVKLAKRGRHFNVGLWTVSQRPSDISPHLRSELNSNESWYLRLSEVIDLEVMQQRRGKDFAKEVSMLPNFTAVKLEPGIQGWKRFAISPDPRISLIGKTQEEGNENY